MPLMFRNGKLLILGGKLAMHPDCCCETEPPAPCSCIAPYDDYPTTTFPLKVDDTSVAELITCAAGLLGGWTGDLMQNANCEWIDGTTYGTLRLGGVDPDCYWEYEVTDGMLGYIWLGRKETGLTPNGVYVKVDGTCDWPSITISDAP